MGRVSKKYPPVRAVFRSDRFDLEFPYQRNRNGGICTCLSGIRRKERIEWYALGAVNGFLWLPVFVFADNTTTQYIKTQQGRIPDPAVGCSSRGKSVKA